MCATSRRSACTRALMAVAGVLWLGAAVLAGTDAARVMPAFQFAAPKFRQTRSSVCPARLGAKGVLRLRASRQGDSKPEVDEIMEGIAQLQAGMAAIQAGLGRRAWTAKESVQSNVAASLTAVQDAVGAEVYLEKMEKARYFSKVLSIVALHSKLY